MEMFQTITENLIGYSFNVSCIHRTYRYLPSPYPPFGMIDHVVRPQRDNASFDTRDYHILPINILDRLLRDEFRPYGFDSGFRLAVSLDIITESPDQNVDSSSGSRFFFQRFWEIAIPCMTTLILFFVWGDVKSAWRYVMGRRFLSRVRRVSVYLC